MWLGAIHNFDHMLGDASPNVFFLGMQSPLILNTSSGNISTCLMTPVTGDLDSESQLKYIYKKNKKNKKK